MQNLEKETYWKLDLTKLKSLIFCYFAEQVNFAEDMHLKNDSCHLCEGIKKDLEQELTDDLINDLLISEDYKIERIDQAIWLLAMRDVLPEGNYLVSIDW